MYRVLHREADLPLALREPAVTLFVVRGRGREVVELARHLRSVQLLAALDGRRWALWLAAPGPVPQDPRWVELEPDQAALLDAGTWHHGPIPLEAEEGRYLTVEERGTNRLDHQVAPARWTP